MILTLEGIFIIIIVILMFATATCWAIEQFNPFMLFTIPGVIIAIFILTMCIATPSPPTVAEPGHYCCDRAGSYGYLDDGKVTYVIPPGKSLFKWPWSKFTTTSADFTYFKTIEVPTQTTDGMRLMFNIGFPVDSVKFDPYKYHTLYNHNYTNYANHVIKRVQPIVNRWMSTVSEADFETGNVDHDAMEAEISPIIPTDGVIWNGPPDYVMYFSHIDNPQMSYACTGVGAGYCAYGDSLGLPSASNRYIPGMTIPNRHTPTPTPTITEEPTKSYTYIDDSNAPSTQEEMNAFIDACIADPECGG
jgi:hypothetical protein